MESLDNLDMLLANMKNGDAKREQAIHKLGEKYSVFEEQDAQKRLVDQQPIKPTPVQKEAPISAPTNYSQAKPVIAPIPKKQAPPMMSAPPMTSTSPMMSEQEASSS